MESIKKRLDQLINCHSPSTCQCHDNIDIYKSALETAVESLERIHEETKGTCVRKIGCVDCESRKSLIKIERILNEG